MAIVPPGGLLTAVPMIVPSGRAKELTKYMSRLRHESRWLPNAGTTIEAP
jgi:hypothetical protein